MPSNNLIIIAMIAVLLVGIFIGMSKFDLINRPQKTGEKEAAKTQEKEATKTQEKEIDSISQPVLGSSDAPVTVIEFAEFYCPYCNKYRQETFPKIYEEYIKTGKIEYVFSNLVVHGPSSLLASVGGECALKNGNFWEFHHRVFEEVFPEENQGSHQTLDAKDLREIASEVDLEGFDKCLKNYTKAFESCKQSYTECKNSDKSKKVCSKQFNSCLSSNEMVKEIAKDQKRLRELINQLPEDEKEKAKRIGTPTFFINGHILIGAQPYSNFKKIIDEELKQAD